MLYNLPSLVKNQIDSNGEEGMVILFCHVPAFKLIAENTGIDSLNLKSKS